MTKVKEKKKNFLALIILTVGLIALAFIVFDWLITKNPTPITNPAIETRNCLDTSAKYLDPSIPIEDRITDLLGRMTEAEKIGQLGLVEKNSLIKTQHIADYHLGALLSGAGAKPKPNTPEAWLKMVENFDAATLNTCLKIPLLYGVDANHGHANVPGAVVFPHAIGLGAANDTELIRRVAQATREELLATGIRWTFGPDLDVTRDLRWGRTYETFGSNAQTVTELGRAYLNGLQNPNSAWPMVLGTAKHYIGTGAMTWGTSINSNFKIDQGDSQISEAELRYTHLPPFQAAIDEGALSVMAGLNKWQGKNMATQRYLLTDVLKKELDFKGFVVSDWYGVYEISNSKYKSLVTAINAGVDMIMLPFDYQQFTTDLQKALQNHDISQTRLDDAVSRILRAKFSLGLFDQKPTKVDLSILGSSVHRELAREAVRKSLVELKNKNNTLPLANNLQRIVVAGSAADNLGQQMGAWTVEWQGIDGNWVPGTTILSGIKQTVSTNTIVDYNLEGKFTNTDDLADIGIAVVGEKPYAEGWGDNQYLKLSTEDLVRIKRVKAASKKLLVIIVSGRPLDIGTVSKDWDAIVAAWLPGSEGSGVADVLFGDYDFVGQLPVPWNIE
ncbi:MAG: glycoside hydrolase family 3 protein [Patescibacteria group bacterium]|jgi:beta-glucosidase